MDNHPIPQDVTSFQFKLIGNMTIKQFAFLAAGIVIAWVVYALPIYSLIKFPLMALFGGTGAALAFLPIEGRPMDVMISNFAKAVFNPTQFIYHQFGGSLYFIPQETPKNANHSPSQANKEVDKNKLETFLNNLPQRPRNKLDEKEMIFLKSLSAYSAPQLQTQPTTQPDFIAPHLLANQEPQMDTDEEVLEEKDSTLAKPDLLPEDESLKKQAAILEKELAKAKAAEEAQARGTREYEAAHQKVQSLEQTLEEALSQKNALEKELIELRKKLEQGNKQVYKPSTLPNYQPQTITKNVRSIPKDMQQKTGMLLAPDFPNVIAGIIKDPRGNPLPNILVEVRDNEGNPIRAFKTSRLGQFASATALSDGDYTIEFEDPNEKNKFDTIGFSASGNIIQPVEVISLDEREELRKSLFN
ncbi:PrgI family protein [Patescibacteria group bacterium]|nr:PrgI family protein [Patescibacteria group bacterium]